MPIGTKPRRIAQPPSWRDLADLAEAQQITGLTSDALAAAVDERDVCTAQMLTSPGTRREVLRRHIPNPAGRNPLHWRRGELTLWALRLGIYPALFEGVDVIGYTGVALMYDVEEQSVRDLVSVEEYAPGPVFEVDKISLFDRLAMRAYGVHTMRLVEHDDGTVTPNRLRPRRT